jgi:hypothetical protein
VTPLDWVFQHWSPRNVTSSHNDCLTKRAVGELAVGKQARKYSLIGRAEEFVFKYRIVRRDRLRVKRSKKGEAHSDSVRKLRERPNPAPKRVFFLREFGCAITSTGNWQPISSTGTSTGSAKSHFRYCSPFILFVFWLGRLFSMCGASLPSGQIYQN